MLIYIFSQTCVITPSKYNYNNLYLKLVDCDKILWNNM